MFSFIMYNFSLCLVIYFLIVGILYNISGIKVKYNTRLRTSRGIIKK